jgi:hypothetical protein
MLQQEESIIMTSYSIVGVFEEPLDESFGTAEPSLKGQRLVRYVSFEGFIGQEMMNEVGLEGEGYTEDRHGLAILTDVVLDEDKGVLSFTKQYEEKEWSLYYSFTKENEVWKGTWEAGDRTQGIILAKGTASCLVAEIPKNTIQ